MNLEPYHRRLDPLLAERSHASRQVRAERFALAEAELDVVASAEAQAVFQQVAQALQQRAHKSIASVVTRCLRAVGFNYDFKIEFDRKRGKTEARLLFVKGGVEHSPLKMSGGGAVDVAAFALRLIAVMLSRPASRRFLCLDEPFSRVRGEAHQGKIPLLLQALAKELDFQFLIVSPHGFAEMEVGKVVDFDDQ